VTPKRSTSSCVFVRVCAGLPAGRRSATPPAVRRSCCWRCFRNVSTLVHLHPPDASGPDFTVRNNFVGPGCANRGGDLRGCRNACGERALEHIRRMEAHVVSPSMFLLVTRWCFSFGVRRNRHADAPARHGSMFLFSGSYSMQTRLFKNRLRRRKLAGEQKHRAMTRRRVRMPVCAERKLKHHRVTNKTSGRNHMSLNRRNVLKGALAAGVAASAKVPAAVAQPGPIQSWLSDCEIRTARVRRIADGTRGAHVPETTQQHDRRTAGGVADRRHGRQSGRRRAPRRRNWSSASASTASSAPSRPSRRWRSTTSSALPRHRTSP